jgi:hypothetical protein
MVSSSHSDSPGYATLWNKECGGKTGTDDADLVFEKYFAPLIQRVENITSIPAIEIF